MPEPVEDCVDSVLEDNPDYSESRAYAICWSQQNKGDVKEAGGEFECSFTTEVVDLSKDDDTLTKEEAASVVAVSKLSDEADGEAVKSVSHYSLTGQWGGYHPAEKTKEGRQHLLETYKSEVNSLLKEWRRVVDEVKEEEDDVENVTVDKSGDDLPTVKFKMKSSTGILPLFKADDGDMIIWGPASVEVVDKEGDKIRASALEEALPQLLRRQRLSLEHSDQLVGKILESFETDEPVTVKINGKEYTREDFPTGVLELDGMEPSLFVCGKVWDDTRQARQTQKDIEEGKIDSYSISGESLVATTKYEEGDVVNDIKELDLSAVTLCEEGMNQKAKFGVVSKADGDARTDEGDKSENAQAGVSKGTRGPDVHADGQIKIIKNMGDQENESEGASNPSEAVSLDDVREEFKNVVEESLPDGDLATKEDMVSKEDVEAIVEEKSMDEEDVRSIALKTVEDVISEEEKGEDYDEDEDEMEDEEKMECEVCGEEHPPGECPEEKADDEMSPEEEPVEEVEDDELEDPDDDGQQEVEIEDDEEKGGDYEEEDEEDDEEEMKGYDHSDLEEMLPEDLYEAVREHLDEEPEEGMEEEEMVEASEDASETEEEDEEVGDVEKMIEEEFGDEMVLDSPTGPTEEVQKSWEQEDEPETDSQVGPAAQQLYDLN